jgi:hypothetical protein
LRCVGFSDFLIFQRVRRPTSPQDAHVSCTYCCVVTALPCVALMLFWERNTLGSGNAVLPHPVLRSLWSHVSALRAALRIHTQFPQYVVSPISICRPRGLSACMKIRLGEVVQIIDEALPSALLDQGPITLGRHCAYTEICHSGDWRIMLVLNAGSVCAK